MSGLPMASGNTGGPSSGGAAPGPGHRHDDGHDHSGHSHEDGHSHDDGHDHSGHAQDEGRIHVDGHSHGDGHDHNHAIEPRNLSAKRKQRLWIAIILGACVMAAEIAGGLSAKSLVLLADAAHYATDLAAVGIALVAVMWSEKAATRRKSFGYHRSEVIAAFVNALALWGISLYFIFEAVQRIRSPVAVHGPIVFAMGFVTLAVNLLLARLLHGASHGNLNMRAAYLHVLSDALGSLGALVAGALVYYKHWNVADPILTVFITVLILIFTWRLTRQTLHILMQGTPHHIDTHEVERNLKTIPHIKEVHDLHVWTLTDGNHTLTAHVVLDENPRDDAVMHQVHALLKDKYHLDHVTVQVESPSCPCGSPCAIA